MNILGMFSKKDGEVEQENIQPIEPTDVEVTEGENEITTPIDENEKSSIENLENTSSDYKNNEDDSLKEKELSTDDPIITDVEASKDTTSIKPSNKRRGRKPKNVTGLEIMQKLFGENKGTDENKDIENPEEGLEGGMIEVAAQNGFVEVETETNIIEPSTSFVEIPNNRDEFLAISSSLKLKTSRAKDYFIGG